MHAGALQCSLLPCSGSEFSPTSRSEQNLLWAGLWGFGKNFMNQDTRQGMWKTVQLPYYQAEGTLRSRVILNTLGRRALSFPWASLTPQQSQFTLLDFQSMESLMLGEIGFLARDKLPGRQRALAMAVFSPLSKPQLFQRPPHPMDKSHRAKIQPLLLISDQEWANSLAQGGYRKRAKLQKTGRAMTQLLCAQFSLGACSWSLWGRQRSQKHFSNKVRTVFSAWGTQGFHPLASLVSSCAWALQAQAL